MSSKWTHKCPYEREAAGDQTMEKEGGDVMIKTRGWNEWRKGS